MAERKGTIYKIVNKQNNKVYIGQTTKSPFSRLAEHYKYSKTGCVQDGLHRDLALYGVCNFSIEIVEEDIPLSKLDEREIHYIAKFNSFTPNGYNLTRGGQYENRHTKLTETDVRYIIKRIKEGAAFKDLADTFNVNYSTISDINCGDTWFFADETYPIRQQTGAKKNFPNSDILKMYSLLKSGYSLTYVSKEFNTSVQTIRRINLGEIYAQEGVTYPISNLSRKNLSNDVLQDICYDLENTTLSYNDIARKYNVDRHTVSCINNGSRYLQRIEKIGYSYFPIRDE